MKKRPLILLTLGLATFAAAAQTASAPESTLSFNAGLVSDYRYRGISQSRMLPALQGGVDYAHSSGLYVGAWGSTIKWIYDNGYDTTTAQSVSSGDTELDLYGGYKFEVMKDITLDLGVLSYQYLGNTLEKNLTFVNANTNEVYAAVTTGPYTAKYSYSTGNIFGWRGSAGSGYLDLSATYEMGTGLNLIPHVGRQTINGTDSTSGVNASYNDVSLTLAKDYGNGLVASAALYGTNADKGLYTSVYNNKYLGDTGAVIGIKYTF